MGRSNNHPDKRKECIGDAVLELIIREEFVFKPGLHHIFTSISSNVTLARIANELGLKAAYEQNHIVYVEGGENRPFANALELEVYKHYEQGGLDQARKFVLGTVVPIFEQLKNQTKCNKNQKEGSQAWTQKKEDKSQKWVDKPLTS
jgi:dsRNA-specific ribonuclease